MNERIRKLAERCRFRSNPNVYDRNQSFDTEKFAELIVKECCQKLEDDGMVEVAMEMKHHFGVEE